MESKNQNEKIEEEPKGRPRWIKVFLFVNLALLTAFLIVEFSGVKPQSEEEKKKESELRAEHIAKALSKNPDPSDYTGKTSGVIRYSIDASEFGVWNHFSFSKVSIVKKSKTLDRESLEWDIAFMRAKIVTNGGDTNKRGKAAVAVARPGIAFENVTQAPPANHFRFDSTKDNRAEPENPAIDKWYDYDFWTHELKAKEVVYVLRDAKGRLVKFVIESYYCQTAKACYTFRYQYQGEEKDSFPAIP